MHITQLDTNEFAGVGSLENEQQIEGTREMLAHALGLQAFLDNVEKLLQSTIARSSKSCATGTCG